METNAKDIEFTAAYDRAVERIPSEIGQRTLDELAFLIWACRANARTRSEMHGQIARKFGYHVADAWDRGLIKPEEI